MFVSYRRVAGEFVNAGEFSALLDAFRAVRNDTFCIISPTLEMEGCSKGWTMRAFAGSHLLSIENIFIRGAEIRSNRERGVRTIHVFVLDNNNPEDIILELGALS